MVQHRVIFATESAIIAQIDNTRPLWPISSFYAGLLDNTNLIKQESQSRARIQMGHLLHGRLKTHLVQNIKQTTDNLPARRICADDRCQGRCTEGPHK